MYDLLDIETFIDVFPGELFFLSGEADYKPTFARKLALTAVKKRVHGPQIYKKDKDSVSKSSFPAKDDVDRACILVISTLQTLALIATVSSFTVP